MITSSQNPKIQQVRRLSAKKREREESGCYLIEGVRLVEEALKYADDCSYLLYAEPLNERARNLVYSFQQRGIETEEISSQLMASSADTDTPQGVLAVMRMHKAELPVRGDFFVLADGIQDPGNLGTLFRTCAAAGVQSLVLMPGCVDVYNPKVIRSAMGAHFRLPFFQMSWLDAGIWLRGMPGMQILTADSNGGKSCWEMELKQPTTLIIGSEGAGPCAQALALSDGRILIPMPGNMESLNAGIAAGILIFEVVRQRL